MAQADKNEVTPDIDFNLFRNIEPGDHCGGNEHHGHCQSLERVVAALDYYQFLVLSKETAKYGTEPKAAFTSFCEELYPKKVLLNDYIHWVLHHKDPESVKALRKRLQFLCDSATSCGATTRHYRVRGDDEDGAEDAPPNWFVDKMDSIHFNVYHLNELGLRVEVDSAENTSEDEKRGDSDLVDQDLKNMTKVIEAKRAFFSNERLDGAANSKFTLQINEEKEGGLGAGGDGVQSLCTLRVV